MTPGEIWRFLQLYAASSALTVAIYTMFGRDAKLRESARDFIGPLVGLVLSTLFGVTALVLAEVATGKVFPVVSPSIRASRWANYCFLVSSAVFLVSISYVVWLFLKVHARTYHLRDDNFMKFLGPLKWIRQKSKRGTHYELRMIERKMPQDSFPCPALADLLADDSAILARGGSILLTGPPHAMLRELAVEVLIEGLRIGETANYVCCNRHPQQVWETVKIKFPQVTDSDLYKDFIFIDAFTPNYGFDDEILHDRLLDLRREGVQVVGARTIPGIHSATAKAFKITKKRRKRELGSEVRRPNRMVYDSVSSLADISSPEQIKIFFNHMIPGERTYGMVTVIIEEDGADQDIIQTASRLVDVILEVKAEDNHTRHIQRRR